MPDAPAPPGLLRSGVDWLDNAVAQAGMPVVLDAEAANELYCRLTGNVVSDEYFQRLPIEYRRPGRMRIYDLDAVIAFAKAQRARAVPKTPKPQKRRSRRQLIQTPSPNVAV